MTLNSHPTYYDVLDIKPDAAPHEIREGYLRIKATYNKDSAALYTLIGSDEREGMLRLIEEAYEILSHPEKRKEYDRYHGLISDGLDPTTHARPPNRKIISIDRVPPMEAVNDADDLLVAPSTDFSQGPETIRSGAFGNDTPFLPPASEPRPPLSSPVSAVPPPVQRQMVQSPPPAMRPQAGPVMINPFMETPPVSAPPPAPGTTPAPGAQTTSIRQKQEDLEAFIAREIETETEWTGLFLRRVREARRISIEELSSITKITKTYLIAIEEENFGKLPAVVFVRGFVTQVARTLKLPMDRVATAYLARYIQSPQKKK